MDNKIVKDQMGFEVRIPKVPLRIISLVPSQTELLFDLGLDKEIVGVTKFCIHPRDRCNTKKVIGGTKKFNFQIIDDLKPDLILGNKEENYREGIEQLKNNYPVWISDIASIEDAKAMILNVGKIVGRFQSASKLVREIDMAFETIPRRLSADKVLYFIWQSPKMVAARGTFIDHILEKIGYQNLAREMSRYPELSDEQIRELNPDLIFLSSEPFPFKEKHRVEFQKNFPKSKVCLVDGEMFSWYGSRLRLAPQYFNQL